MATLKNIVVFEKEFPEGTKELAEKAGLNLYTIWEVIEKGREASKNGTATVVEASPDDVVALSYTSGTTGDPKGVKLTHKMLMTTSYGLH